MVLLLGHQARGPGRPQVLTGIQCAGAGGHLPAEWEEDEKYNRFSRFSRNLKVIWKYPYACLFCLFCLVVMKDSMNLLGG